MASYKEGGYDLEHTYFLDYKDGYIITVKTILQEDPWESDYEDEAQMICNMLNEISNDTVFKVIGEVNRINSTGTSYSIIIDYTY